MCTLRSQAKDARSVAAAPGKLLSATRMLVPRLAEHVSPSRLLSSMVKELNESIQAQAHAVSAHGVCGARGSGVSGGSADGTPVVQRISVPTEAALREHNEYEGADRPDAAAAAAAVFSRLPVAMDSDWCDDLTEPGSRI